MFIGIITLITALGIAGVAAYYSIIGLMAIFSGAAFAIAIAAGSLEVGKIAAVIWLHHHWETVTRKFKYLMSAQVIVLMFITSMGIFGFLSKAHIQQNADSSVVATQLDRIAASQVRLDTRRQQLVGIQDQLDKAINEYTDRGYVTRGLKARAEQAPERESIRQELNQLDKREVELDEKRFELSNQITELELDVGPAKYIAELLYGEEAENNFDKAVRIVILLIIFVFDPLAVTLLIAAQIAFAARKPKIQITEKPKVEEPAKESEYIEPEPEFIEPEVEVKTNWDIPEDSIDVDSMTEDEQDIHFKKTRMRDAGKTSSM